MSWSFLLKHVMFFVVGFLKLYLHVDVLSPCAWITVECSGVRTVRRMSSSLSKYPEYRVRVGLLTRLSPNRLQSLAYKKGVTCRRWHSGCDPGGGFALYRGDDRVCALNVPSALPRLHNMTCCHFEGSSTSDRCLLCRLWFWHAVASYLFCECATTSSTVQYSTVSVTSSAVNQKEQWPQGCHKRPWLQVHPVNLEDLGEVGNI